MKKKVVDDQEIKLIFNVHSKNFSGTHMVCHKSPVRQVFKILSVVTTLMYKIILYPPDHTLFILGGKRRRGWV